MGSGLTVRTVLNEPGFRHGIEPGSDFDHRTRDCRQPHAVSGEERRLQTFKKSIRHFRSVNLRPARSGGSENQPAVVRSKIRMRVRPLFSVMFRAAVDETLAFATLK